MTVGQFVEENLPIFYKMDGIGVKNISSAIDYLSIQKIYEQYAWIEKEMDRKRTVAIQCKVSVNTVSNAIKLLSSKL